MPTFPDLASLHRELDSDHLKIPINGRVYTFTSRVSIDTGLRIVRLREELAAFTASLLLEKPVAPDTELLDDVRESELIRDLIGAENLAQMRADGLMWPDVKRVGETLIAWHLHGADAALTAWVGTGGGARPPASPEPSSSPPTTSRSGSTKKTSRTSKATNGRASAGRKSSRSSA